MSAPDAYTAIDHSILPQMGKMCPKCGKYLVPPQTWNSVVPPPMCDCHEHHHCGHCTGCCPCHTHTFGPRWDPFYQVTA